MAADSTSKDTEDAPEGTSDDTPTDAAEAAPEEAPGDTPEEAPEAASADAPGDTLDPVEDPGKGDGSKVSEPAPAAVASGPPRRLGRPGRTAAIAVGAALALAAVVVGAVWAVAAILEDDDHYGQDQAVAIWEVEVGGDLESHPEFRPRGRVGKGEPGFGGHRLDRFGRDRAERPRSDRERSDEHRDRRDERGAGRSDDGWSKGHGRSDGHGRSKGDGQPGRAAPSRDESCTTLLSCGEGPGAVTLLLCTGPGESLGSQGDQGDRGVREEGLSEVLDDLFGLGDSGSLPFLLAPFLGLEGGPDSGGDGWLEEWLGERPEEWRWDRPERRGGGRGRWPGECAEGWSLGPDPNFGGAWPEEWRPGLGPRFDRRDGHLDGAPFGCSRSRPFVTPGVPFENDPEAGRSGFCFSENGREFCFDFSRGGGPGAFGGSGGGNDEGGSGAPEGSQEPEGLDEQGAQAVPSGADAST